MEVFFIVIVFLYIVITEWFKINPDHRLEKGHALYATFDPENGGTLYHVIDVNDKGFTIESHNHDRVDIPGEQRKTHFVPYEMIPITNLHVWDRHRETNYE